MSFSREGIVWEQANGAGWRYGMFEHHVIGEDAEWDVEVDHGHFSYVSPIAATASDAYHTYPGPNPGGFIEEDGEDVAMWDRMAAAWLERERGRAARTAAYWR